MGRHIAANALTLIIVGLVLLGGVLGWAQREFSGEGPLESAMCLRVDRGSTLLAVSRDLEAHGAISSGTIFRIGARYTEKADQLRFGSYILPEGASMQQILETITTPSAEECADEIIYRIGVTTVRMDVRVFDDATQRAVPLLSVGSGGVAFPEAAQPAEEVLQAVRAVEDLRETDLDTIREIVRLVRPNASIDEGRIQVVVAEGTTVWQVVEALNRAEFLTGEVSGLPPEGLLAPGSYETRRGAERAALLAEMQARQERILAQLWDQRVGGLPVSTPEEALILASIIEKETSVPDERGKVASVFVNRLRLPMRLQTDPTVIYGITLGRGTLGRGLRQSELRGATPYNTYVIDGLPPTPIANPGRASIAAALNPDDTPYLYFVADGTGGHAFATNLADHNRNVARWRQIEAERRGN